MLEEEVHALRKGETAWSWWFLADMGHFCLKFRARIEIRLNLSTLSDMIVDGLSYLMKNHP